MQTSGVHAYGFDRDLLAQVGQTSQPGFSVYPFSFPAVVAGRGSDLDEEVSLSLCRDDGIPVFRRSGGGCAVFLDPGTLIVSIALPARGFAGIQRLFNFCNHRLILGLEHMGLSGISQDGISDLVLGKRKVGGSSFYRSSNLAYYTAALLVSTDLDAMDRYLYHPPREPAYRKKRPHKAFVTRLADAFPGLTPPELSAGLRSVLAVTI